MGCFFFFLMMKGINPQIQEAQQTPNKINAVKAILRHITEEFLKI